jgi:hypothetical protein
VWVRETKPLVELRDTVLKTYVTRCYCHKNIKFKIFCGSWHKVLTQVYSSC